MIDRRNFIKSGAAAAALGGLAAGPSGADVPVHLWQGYDFGPGPPVPDRLNQGPFGDQGVENWATICSTSPSREQVRNFGTGLVGYTWEEAGPSLAARRGEETLERHVEKLAALPFVDVLYIRCDWRDVQNRPGRLDLHPIWKLTFDAARTYGLRVGFRVQLSNTVYQPERVALPDFLQPKIPLVEIGSRGGTRMREPMYHHPEFLKAFRELNELLAAELDDSPLVEYMDLMMYGFWGEGHTGGLPSPFPDYLTAEKTMTEITRLQLDTWKRVPLAVNTQPDSSHAGNREVLDMTVRSGGWLRSDSIIHDEPIQVERLANRPPWLAVIMEQGWRRDYDLAKIPVDEFGVNAKEKSMLKVLELRGNYWSLWTEADNLADYYRRCSGGIDTLRQRMGYRVRPSWVWQREREGSPELIVGFANDGVAGVPGVLRVTVASSDGSFETGGCLDAGRPYGGEVRQAGFLLPVDMYGKKVRIRGEIITNGVKRPLQWACAERTEEDKSLAVQLRDKGKLVWGEAF
ncbi:MAG: twin-arginine translocation signal domain-containing protein [Candidatus Glassbacteria bacterium]|nr:twin-arginine translocation signal domain-containing protein [Candidatus Glassbacteria bacterium]